MVYSSLHRRTFPRWAAVLSATLIVAFLGLVGADIHCQYESLFPSQHEHQQPGSQQTGFSHCLYAHQAASTALVSLALVGLHSIEVVGSSSLDEPLIHVSTARTSLAARAPPAV